MQPAAAPRSSGSTMSASPSRMPPSCRSPTLGRRHSLPLRPDARPRHGAHGPEIARVVRPGGRAVLAVWATPTTQSLDDRRREGGARARAHRPPRPERPVRFGSRTPTASTGRGGAAGSRSTPRGGARPLAGRLARRMVGGDPRHVAVMDCSVERSTGPRSRLSAKLPSAGCRSLSRRTARSPCPGSRACVARRTAAYDTPRQRIVWPSALATSSTAVSAVVFSRSRIGFASTTSKEPTMPDSAISSQARWASR